jgi:S1-C subfamily serine protease
MRIETGGSGVCAAFVWALLALFPVAATPAAAASPGIREAMVRIFTVQTRPNYEIPWSMHSPESFSASGFVIAGKMILTNAHAVADQTYIEVRRHGVAEKYPAKIRAISHTADLALLTVADPAFYEGAVPLEFGELPPVQSEVVVYGFPTGGDSLSSTRGVISRIEQSSYAHSSTELLTAQIDAAVNPGNSGGPVLAGERVVGVVMQNLPDADNIGYMVPAPVVRHFLADLADGRYDGFPSVGIRWQALENDSLRRKSGLAGKETGVLVRRVVPGSAGEGIILPGDVITAIDGRRIAGDGTVEIRPDERTGFSAVIQERQIGATVTVDLLRSGARKSVEVVLTSTIEGIRLVPREQYDVRPSYFVYGGLVFQPLTRNYLEIWGDEWYDIAPTPLLAIYLEGERSVVDEQVVVLTNVLLGEVNRGYEEAGYSRIVSVNGARVRNLAELVRLTEQGDGSPYTVFTAADGTVLSLDRQLVAATAADLLKQYRIPADRSEDLLRK